MQLQTSRLGSEPVLALGVNQAGGLTLALVSLVDRTKRWSRSRAVLNSLRGQSLGAEAKHKAVVTVVRAWALEAESSNSSITYSLCTEVF